MFNLIVVSNSLILSGCLGEVDGGEAMIPGAEAEGSKTSITTSTSMARDKRVTSVEDINKMSNDEIRSFSLSGRAKRRLAGLCGSMDYFQAKRQVIQENYERSLITKDTMRVKGPMSQPRRPSRGMRLPPCPTLRLWLAHEWL